MKYLLLILLMSITANAKMERFCKQDVLRVAIIDTGFGYHGAGQNAKLCPTGHKNFVDLKNTTAYGTIDPVPLDTHSHGTNIAGLVSKYADMRGAKYCLIIIKYYDEHAPYSTYRASIHAIEYAIEANADIINYSGGGTQPSKSEAAAIKKFLFSGGMFIAASGNERNNLGKRPYYPAMTDDRIWVVGNLDKSGNSVAGSSDYGYRVDEYENGTKAEAYGITLTGTSQATAIATGKKVGEISNACDRLKQVDPVYRKSLKENQ